MHGGLESLTSNDDGSSRPRRPAGVPATAAWIETEREWQERRTDELGRLHGRFRSWRSDGSVRVLRDYDHGKQSGAAWTFHPDGSLFSLGCYVDGKERGVHRRYANRHPNAELLQSCCVPPGAWALRDDHAARNGFGRAWFDQDGQRLTGAGELYPSLPPAVPGEAWFNEELRAWEIGVVWQSRGYTGQRRRWSLDGVLRLVEDLTEGERQGRVQSFDEGGNLEWEGQFIDDKLSGDFQARYGAGSKFADPNLRGHAGAFEAGQVLGIWRYFDANGTTVARRDLGLPIDEQALAASPAVVDERRSASAWKIMAEELFAARRVGEALIVSARAAARSLDVANLARSLDAWIVPLDRAAASAEARHALGEPGCTSSTLVDSLKRGGDPAALLWGLSKCFPDRDRMALDLVSAAILLEPSAVEYVATRVLLHGALGELRSARADVARVAAASPEQASFLDLYLRVYFPRFTFWPALESFPEPALETGLTVDRTVVEVREAIARYATRLQRLRAGLLDRLANERDERDGEGSEPSSHARILEEPFMIPDLSALLPAGPVPLTRWTLEMSAEEYEGEAEGEIAETEPEGPTAPGSASQPDGVTSPRNALPEDRGGPSNDVPDERPRIVELIVDEARGIAPMPTTVPRILRQARADWSGLAWLCWAVGSETPALPDAICPPAAFASAAMMTVERTWRCRDKLRTSGLLALTKGVPGFDWEDTQIDLVPAALADVALDQYLEARAVFSWLCDRANRSPWQNDLRDGDT